MKKILFLAICGLVLAGSVSAQGYYGPRRVRRAPPRRVDEFYKVRVGITGGMNFANTVDAYNSDYTTGGLVGFNAGLTLDIPIVYPLSFAPEVLYSQKGFTSQTTDGNYTQRNNYIDVPLLAKLRVSPSFSFVIGPQLSFPISTTQTFDDGFAATSRESYSTTNDKTIMDGVVGVSFDLSQNVELRLRYAIDLQQNDENTATTGYDYRNQVWQIGLGFKFQ
jgi:opacity protein-like surface antigen